MIRIASGAAAVAAGLVTSLPALAADPILVEKLAPEISTRCDAVSQRIAARQLGQALEASAVAPLTYTSEWATDAADRIARAAFSNATGPNEAALDRLQRLVQTWINPGDASSDDYLPLEAGGVRISYLSARPASPAEAEAALAAILSGDDSRFAFTCRPATTTPGPAPDDDDDDDENGEPVRLALARTPDDLQADLDDKAFAEFSYVHDEETDESNYGIHATLGLIGPRLTARSRRPSSPGPGVFVEVRPVGLVQYEREGSGEDDAEEVNNLNFGLQLGGFIQTRSRTTLSHYYAVTARYLTDDRFESSAWSLGATFTPQFPVAGNDVPFDLIPNRLRFRWLVTGAADHFSVSDPGRKSALQDANEFTRLGFDLDGELRLLLGDARDGAISLRGEYQLREAIGGSIGDAQFLTGSLAFEPIPHVAVGLTYTRGENIDSLEFSEQWKFTFGLRW